MDYVRTLGEGYFADSAGWTFGVMECPQIIDLALVESSVVNRHAFCGIAVRSTNYDVSRNIGQGVMPF